MDIKVENNQVVVTRPNDLKKMKSLHGLTRTLVANMVTGVTKGYEKVLEINGVGYRAQKQGKKLILSLGYSHPVEMEDPEGLESVIRRTEQDYYQGNRQTESWNSTQLKSEKRETKNLTREKVSSMLMK